MTRVAVLFAASLAACGNGSSSQCPANSTGGAVSGAADTHCAGNVVTVDQAACSPPAADAGVGPDAGEEAAETLFNAEGDDDDCKYHVAWSSTPVCANGDITFTLTITAKVDGSPVLGASPNIEALLTEIHPAPSAGSTSELGSGVYTIGPVRFDAPGRWTVRFHIFDTCHDSEESPHGHAAFFVQVP